MRFDSHLTHCVFSLSPDYTPSNRRARFLGLYTVYAVTAFTGPFLVEVMTCSCLLGKVIDSKLTRVNDGADPEISRGRGDEKLFAAGLTTFVCLACKRLQALQSSVARTNSWQRHIQMRRTDSKQLYNILQAMESGIKTVPCKAILLLGYL